MGKLAAQKMDLVKRILETEDGEVLRSVDEVLSGGVQYSFTAEEMAVFQDRLARYQADGSSSSDWATVKRKLKAKLRS